MQTDTILALEPATEVMLEEVSGRDNLPVVLAGTRVGVTGGAATAGCLIPRIADPPVSDPSDRSSPGRLPERPRWSVPGMGPRGEPGGEPGRESRRVFRVDLGRVSGAERG